MAKRKYKRNRGGQFSKVQGAAAARRRQKVARVAGTVAGALAGSIAGGLTVPVVGGIAGGIAGGVAGNHAVRYRQMTRKKKVGKTSLQTQVSR